MNLDIYLFKMKKLSENQLKLIDGGRKDAAYEAFPDLFLYVKDFDTGMTSDFIRGIKDAMSDVMLTSSEICMDKIRKAYGIPDDAETVGTGHTDTEYSWLFAVKGKKGLTEVRITDEEVAEKYMEDVTFKYDAALFYVIDTWKGYVALQDIMYDHFVVENTGYYAIPDDLCEEIAEKGILPKKLMQHEDDEIIAYYEWY